MRVTSFVGGVLLLGAGLAPAGCSKTGNRVEDFTPPADKARRALGAALDHWKAGNPPGTIPGDPPVEAVDARWKAAPNQLKGYEILAEEPPPSDAAPRYFKVRLTPAQGPPQEVRYVVVGIDPLWVYREQDFDALAGTGK